MRTIENILVVCITNGVRTVTSRHVHPKKNIFQNNEKKTAPK